MRKIRRYANRKLYDTQESRYITLADVARMVRAGETVRVEGRQAMDDQTTQTLLQVLLEEERTSPRLSADGLALLIRSFPEPVRKERMAEGFPNLDGREVRRLGETP